MPGSVSSSVSVAGVVVLGGAWVTPPDEPESAAERRSATVERPMGSPLYNSHDGVDLVARIECLVLEQLACHATATSR